MPEKAIGKVRKVNPGKGYRFVSHAGSNDVFIAPNLVPKGTPFVEGEELEYEFEPDPTPGKEGKFRVTQVLSRSPSTTLDITPIPAASPPANNPDTKHLKVSWKDKDPIEQINMIMVKIMIELLHADGLPASGTMVHLFKSDAEGNRTQVKTPSPKPSADDKGEVNFTLYFASDAELCDLVAVADKKEYSYTWYKNKPTQTATPVSAIPAITPAEPEKWTIETTTPRDMIGNGTFFVTVTTRKNGTKTDRQFAYTSSVPMKVMQAQDVSGRRQILETTTYRSQTPGIYELFIGFLEVMAKVTFQLDNGQEAVVRLRK
ncbi:MAG: hypothetical protein ABI643_03570 [Candidatus Doudnabacteria bacterium]